MTSFTSPNGNLILGGSKSFGSRVYQTSIPSFFTMSTKYFTVSGVMKVSPLANRNAGIGTPQFLWRDKHQSGRFSTIERIRVIPQSGTHFTLSIASKEFFRKSFSSILKNHCGVARKINGFLLLQLCGYWCSNVE